LFRVLITDPLRGFGAPGFRGKNVTIFEVPGSNTAIFILGSIVKSIDFQGSREKTNRALGLPPPPPP